MNKITFNWSDLYFLSLAGHEKFIETSVVTLKSHYHDTIINRVYEEMARVQNVTSPGFYANVQARADLLMNEGAYPVREFVQSDEHRTIVCLNVKNIDMLAVEMALERLTSLEKIIPGIYVEFGNPTTFSAKEFLETYTTH
jgi:hypothetical protein